MVGSNHSYGYSSVYCGPVDLNASLDEAHKNRPELRRLNLQKEINIVTFNTTRTDAAPGRLTGTVATTVGWDPGRWRRADKSYRRIRKGPQ